MLDEKNIHILINKNIIRKMMIEHIYIYIMRGLIEDFPHKPPSKTNQAVIQQQSLIPNFGSTMDPQQLF